MYQSPKQQSQHKAQLSYNKLAFLLAILGIVWILCYNAEIQFPARHVLDTYARIGEKDVSKESYKYAVEYLNGNSNGASEHKHRVYLTKKYNLTKSAQSNICIILTHQPQCESWQQSLKSILWQNYTKYKIYYLNNYNNGEQAYHELQTNSLDRGLLKLVENIEGSDYSKEYEYARSYCEKDDIVVYMNDDDRLVGPDVLAFINALFKAREDMKLMYTSSVYPYVKERSKKIVYRVGNSYPYPDTIKQEKKYKNYPFLVDGLLVLKNQVLTSIQPEKLLNKDSQPYKHIGEIALGVNLLELADQGIVYVPEVLLLRGRERNYLTADDEVKGEIADLGSKE